MNRCSSFLIMIITLTLSVAVITVSQDIMNIENYKSNILDDYEKRAEAESFILSFGRKILKEAYLSGTALLYYDPDSLRAYVDDELTNEYIDRQLIYDVDPQKNPEEAKDLYLNHYYSVILEYIGEYDPHQFSIVDGHQGQVRIKIEYIVIEKNGIWEIYSNQYRGCSLVDTESANIRY